MDSITQITLGAAVGEIVLGRKLGNRAMLWGAVAGTMPDLDIMANAATDEISALAYHRAFTHSIAYAALAPFIMGPLVHRLYGGREGPAPESSWLSLLYAWLGLLVLLGIGSWLMPLEVYQIPNIALWVSSASILFPLIIYFRERIRRKPSTNGNVGWKAWAWLFFLCIVTHPLLDTCTTYGTQLLEPFSSVRLGLNNISVADPFYTVPFLICLLVALFLRRNTRSRRWANYLGIGWSSLYMIFTFVNKISVDNIMEQSVTDQNIAIERYMTGPTILNNFLWQGVAEGKDTYYLGQYSLLDEEAVFDLTPVAKGHEMLEGYPENRDLRILRWFTNGYFSITRRADGHLQMNDLRYGSMTNKLDNPDDFVFKFILEDHDGELVARQSEDMPSNRDMGEAMNALMERIKGKKD